jgi:hypothetical protein
MRIDTHGRRRNGCGDRKQRAGVGGSMDHFGQK